MPPSSTAVCVQILKTQTVTTSRTSVAAQFSPVPPAAVHSLTELQARAVGLAPAAMGSPGHDAPVEAHRCCAACSYVKLPVIVWHYALSSSTDRTRGAHLSSEGGHQPLLQSCCNRRKQRDQVAANQGIHIRWQVRGPIQLLAVACHERLHDVRQPEKDACRALYPSNPDCTPTVPKSLSSGIPDPPLSTASVAASRERVMAGSGFGAAAAAWNCGLPLSSRTRESSRSPPTSAAMLPKIVFSAGDTEPCKRGHSCVWPTTLPAAAVIPAGGSDSRVDWCHLGGWCGLLTHQRCKTGTPTKPQTNPHLLPLGI